MATTDPKKLRKLAAALGVGSLLVMGTAACDNTEDTAPAEDGVEAPAEEGGMDEGTLEDGAEESGTSDELGGTEDGGVESDTGAETGDDAGGLEDTGDDTGGLEGDTEEDQ
ncbi:hypothetical protein [Citricoccus muralis]|uniref:Uncharacterized protein n=1 Tax=Citricoccus muralis TaxID=169134 RepID=A0ABY8H853_9MICC|nr:hypothetical protein [Citricoccus muralis]WFP17331.1 hypothetical protein P8192_04255 [Citricoccus muralis]